MRNDERKFGEGKPKTPEIPSKGKPRPIRKRPRVPIPSDGGVVRPDPRRWPPPQKPKKDDA